MRLGDPVVPCVLGVQQGITVAQLASWHLRLSKIIKGLSFEKHESLRRFETKNRNILFIK